VPYNELNWPIAAAMLQFPAVMPNGQLVQDQGADEWAIALQEIADAGFTHVDPTDSWLRLADLSEARLEDFLVTTKQVGLSIPSISTARRSVIDPVYGDEYLSYSHRVLETAAHIGVSVVSFGFLQALTPAQQEALWFWTVPGAKNPDDPAVWKKGVTRLQELGKHAELVGVDIALEMYEDTYLGTADSAVAMVKDINHPRVGLNPDWGNLQRLLRPVERWEVMAEKTLPYAKYWHVKNYFRSEDAATGNIVTAPAPLEFGVINYRKAVRMAIELGYQAPFYVEHYGGDGLSVSATNRDYLRRILPRTRTTKRD
jgi:sugar phosphate isomerase/epimerase